MRIKAAASLDGRIALANGQSQWITGEAARRDVHALRARSCAMLTGAGTVMADDPELTVRHVPCARQPRRVVIDSRLDIDPSAKILRGEPPIIFTVSDDAAKRKQLSALGAEIVDAPVDPRKPGKTDLVAIAQVVMERQGGAITDVASVEGCIDVAEELVAAVDGRTDPGRRPSHDGRRRLETREGSNPAEAFDKMGEGASNHDFGTPWMTARANVRRAWRTTGRSTMRPSSFTAAR